MKVDNTAAKSPLIEQLKLCAILARESPLSTTDHNRIEKEMAFVDQPGSKRKGCQFSTTDGQIIFG